MELIGFYPLLIYGMVELSHKNSKNIYIHFFNFIWLKKPLLDDYKFYPYQLENTNKLVQNLRFWLHFSVKLEYFLVLDPKI